MKKLLLFLCFFISIHAIGQHKWTEGTIHLKNGIVKEGLLRITRISKDYIVFNGKQRVKFKANEKAKKEKYDHTQIDKVVFKNADEETVEYVYIPVSEKKHELFTKIVNGKADLYARIVSFTSRCYPAPVNRAWAPFNGSDSEEFYVWREGEKTASPLITLRVSRSFKKRAMEYFADCPAIVEKLEDKSYQEENIEDVVKAYNNCN
ncbi:MAG: hypothetical protein AAF617_03825 [Bacteroidota bacterium]